MSVDLPGLLARRLAARSLPAAGAVRIRLPWMVPVLMSALVGCKDLTGSQQQLPAGIQNPQVFNTPAGAVGMWAVAFHAVERAIPRLLNDTGLLTDELTSEATGVSQGILNQVGGVPPAGSLDERILPEQSYGFDGTTADQDYGALQQIRGLTSQAVGALAAYDTGAKQQGDPVALQSQLYAFQGYAEILLADFFCSGVPLSTLDYQKDFTYHAGSPTDSVYWDAIHTLKTAKALAAVHDSVSLENLAAVLLGRAYLAVGQYDSAAAAVAAVPTGFAYPIPVDSLIWNQNLQPNFLFGTVADQKGRNGIPFLSSGDPRTSVIVVTAVGARQLDGLPTGTTNAIPLTIPTKYSGGLTGGFIAFTVADWIEARLIQAEAALHTNANDPAWLNILNALRTTAPIPGTTQPATAQQLPQLADPGPSPNDSARVSLLFQERAYWLFLTAHRQGDLRRLIRNYGRNPLGVYPVGPYDAPGGGQYGTDVTAPIPGAEYANPLFQGCLDRSA